MRSKRISRKEIYDFDRLERAADSLRLSKTEENEVKLLNLHNHLIWHSFEPGNDRTADAILLVALKELMRENQVEIEGVPAEFSELLREEVK